jgi:CheY-like chemotaxis protein
MSDRITVLLIDDDPDVQALFQMVLDHHGIELYATDDAAQALTYLAHRTPDVIVTDIFLPTSDGYKLQQAIRDLPHLAHCPIVATTAYYTTDTVGDIQKSGFDGYLLKPLDPQQIAAYLRDVLQTSR